MLQMIHICHNKARADGIYKNGDLDSILETLGVFCTMKKDSKSKMLRSALYFNKLEELL